MEGTRDGALGEVVESSTERVAAEAWELDGLPAFGSLVKVPDGDLVHYGVVSFARTGSIDPGRRPVALGLTAEELRREQPQIFALLRSEFSFIVIGHREAGGPYRGYAAPRPPRLHAFVFPCDGAEAVEVGGETGYVRRLLGEGGGDEVAAAAVRHFRAAAADPAAYTVRAGKELLRALGEDAGRFRALMARLG